MAKFKEMELVGRTEELTTLHYAINSSKSELMVIIGRRRVGKTFFVTQSLRGQLFFEFSGLFQTSQETQIFRFLERLSSKFDLGEIPPISDWFQALDLLKKCILKSRSQKKKIIFLDEFPWINSPKSEFLGAFTEFWNSFASLRNDLLIIISGSAASWMIKKVLADKGGLYNRVTQRIELQAFNLYETELFLRSKGITLKRDSILKLYLVMGGIPYYLDQIRPHESADQAIDRLFFQKKGILRMEFQNLFSSLFDDSLIHEKIIQLLSQNTYGLSRMELLKKTKEKSGGRFTDVLEELYRCGFITIYTPFGKKIKDSIYKLSDPYTLFYMKYILPGLVKKTNQAWTMLSRTSEWISWSGLAFENVCHLHIEQIKHKLNIRGISTQESIWRKTGDKNYQGAQIDLIIDRADKLINLCEIKYSDLPYTLTKEYSNKLLNKAGSFQHYTKTRKTIFVTLICSSGLIPNQYSFDLIKNVVLAEDFFVKI